MAQSVEVISHWHHSLSAFNVSALDFYKAVEDALNAKESPSLRIERVESPESGLLSAKRAYLRVSHARFSFDICAAPFGKDFFFSWWLTKRAPTFVLLYGCLSVVGLPVALLAFVSLFGVFKGLLVFLVAAGVAVFFIQQAIEAGTLGVEDTILAIPVVGLLYTRFFKPVTYYATDTRLIFEESVHRTVVEIIEALMTAKSMTPLSAQERTPVSRGSLF